MSKIKAIAPINFGIIEALRTKSKSVTVENISDSTQAVEIASNKAEFSVDKSGVVLVANFPPNATIYFASNKRVYDANGKYYTTDQGYGIFGVTDANSNLLLTCSMQQIVIDSINGGLPLTYEGLFEDGMWYFADTTGTKVVDQNDPDRSEWFIGTGNADGDIDLDIKMLAITDVVIPETVQLGVAFDVSGNYVMLEPRIVIEAFDGVTWKKIHAGDYIEVADGSFTESVTIKNADGFIANMVVDVRVRSYDGYALNGSDSADIVE